MLSSMENQINWISLTNELWYYIFSHIHIKDLFALECACKTFGKYIKNSEKNGIIYPLKIFKLLNNYNKKIKYKETCGYSKRHLGEFTFLAITHNKISSTCITNLGYYYKKDGIIIEKNKIKNILNFNEMIVATHDGYFYFDQDEYGYFDQYLFTLYDGNTYLIKDKEEKDHIKSCHSDVFTDGINYFFFNKKNGKILFVENPNPIDYQCKSIFYDPTDTFKLNLFNLSDFFVVKIDKFIIFINYNKTHLVIYDYKKNEIKHVVDIPHKPTKNSSFNICEYKHPFITFYMFISGTEFDSERNNFFGYINIDDKIIRFIENKKKSYMASSKIRVIHNTLVLIYIDSCNKKLYLYDIISLKKIFTSKIGDYDLDITENLCIRYNWNEIFIYEMLES